MKNIPRQKSIGAQMIITALLMRKRNHKMLKEAEIEITLDQLAILEILNSKGETNMTKLGYATWKQNANITRLVDKLEERGLVVRKAVKGDRRTNLIKITSSGIELFESASPIVSKTYREIVSSITKEEEQTILRATEKLIKHLS